MQIKSNLEKTVKYIVARSSQLKNKFTDQKDIPVEFACIFCQSENEYQKFTDAINVVGKVVQDTPSGFTYLLDRPIKTGAGLLKLVKIRKPDQTRKERGDADFNTKYDEFKKTYMNDERFELIKREGFEMLRLSDPKFDTMACFSNIPLSKKLGADLWL